MTVGAVRQLADRYLADLARLNPILATRLGEPADGLPDFSPDGAAALAELAASAVGELAALPVDTGDEADERCRRLLTDRLAVVAEQHAAGEHLRPLRVIGSPVEAVRASFDPMPRASEEDWERIGRRLDRVPAAYDSLVASLVSGADAGLFASPRQVVACARMLRIWAGASGDSWFHRFVAPAGESHRHLLQPAADRAAAACARLADHLEHDYLPASAGTPDAVGPERYAIAARQMLGGSLDTDEAYAWAWDELTVIEAQMAEICAGISPGSGLLATMHELDRTGEAVDGEDALRDWLQALMDDTVEALQGTHFDLAPGIRRVEAMIAPPGTAAAQYYTTPSTDLRRPGRTWYPTLGRSRFPLWSEYSTCYHEGVPGHHMQLGHWVSIGEQLSRFQTTMVISGNIEGWALYAERLMDELGYLDDPARRLGYLVAQQLRATRVIVDLGMHLGLVIPAGQSFHPGERWTPELGREFLGLHAGKDEAFLDSEWVRYLGWPSQAITYKLGERVWLAGRDGARRRSGEQSRAFDTKAWHMAALSMGCVTLDDLAAELPTLLG